MRKLLLILLLAIACGEPESVHYNGQNKPIMYKEEELPPSAPYVVPSSNVTQPIANSGGGGGGCFLK